MQFDAKQVRAVLFDAVGTLLFPDPAVAEVYAEVGRRYGSSASPAEISARFRAAFRLQEDLDREQHALRTDERRERLRWRAIVEQVLVDAADPQAAFDRLWEHFAKPTSWRLATNAAAMFAALNRQGMAWGLASNFDLRLEMICRAWPALAGCRHLFVSSQLGWRKPSPEFFRAIERRLGLLPQHLLLVGDDVENDYCAARAAGWQAVLVDGNASGAAEVRIGRLGQLAELLSEE